MKGNILAIKRFEIHDGDGIRTTLFLKGCPLSCIWCHNPESISSDMQIGYYDRKCIGCKECMICSAHVFSKGIHTLDRTKCIACGKCVEKCDSDALVLYGKDMTSEELVPLLIEDAMFYKSGGGVTISGGEPLLQAEFCGELLCKLKKKSINTIVDTCGYADKEQINRIINYTDKFLYDIKAYDEKKHIQLTGRSNRCILENLEYIDSKGKPIEIRIPLITSLNGGEIKKIASFLTKFRNITKVKVLPYHSFGITKYIALDMKYELKDEVLPTRDQINIAIKELTSYGLNAE